MWLKVYRLSTFIVAFFTLSIGLSKETYLNNVHVPHLHFCSLSCYSYTEPLLLDRMYFYTRDVSLL
jgi:hypothetical protein